MKVDAVQFRQQNFNGFLIKVKASEAAKGADWPIQRTMDGFFAIDQRTEINKEGYQRPANKKRYQDFGEFLKSEMGFCPVPIVANLRKEDYQIGIKDNKIEIPDDSKIWICEGQHRLLGYIHALKEYDLDYEIPVVLLNEPKDEEIVHFYIINQKQKSVPTDLAEINLKAYQDRNNRIIPGAKFTNEKDSAIQITRKLNEEANSPFYRYIKITGENIGATIKATSFHNAVAEVVKESEEIWDHRNQNDEVYNVLHSAWKALRELMPGSFDDPRNFVTLKSAGIFVINRVIGKTIDNMTERKGRKKLTVQDYNKLFTHPLVAEYFNDNWWKSGANLDDDSRGAASFGSSQGSFRKIQSLIMRSMNQLFREGFKLER